MVGTIRSAWVFILKSKRSLHFRLLRGTTVNRTKYCLLVVKIGKYIVFSLYHGSYLLLSLAIEWYTINSTCRRHLRRKSKALRYIVSASDAISCCRLVTHAVSYVLIPQAKQRQDHASCTRIKTCVYLYFSRFVRNDAKASNPAASSSPSSRHTSPISPVPDTPINPASASSLAISEASVTSL